MTKFLNRRCWTFVGTPVPDWDTTVYWNTAWNKTWQEISADAFGNSSDALTSPNPFLTSNLPAKKGV